MYIANDLKNKVISDDIYDIRISFIEVIELIIDKFIEDKNFFNFENFSVTYLDEVATDTNCNQNIINTIYLDINQPLNYKLNNDKKIKKKNEHNSQVSIPELYLSLEDITNSLYDIILKTLDPNNIVWKEKYGICIKSSVYSEDTGTKEYYFKIIPCLTYYNKKNIKGVMYYHNKDIEIEYPEMYLDNFNKKNKETNDIYKQSILILKNILLKEKSIEYLPSEIIETILYNVPSKMFVSDNKDTIMSIINYLRNKSLKEYITIDEQDLAFVSIYRSMSPYYVKHILKIIEKYLINN